MLGITDAADIAGCSKDTIRRAIQRGQLPATMDEGPSGFQYWVDPADLEAWTRLRQGRLPSAQPSAGPPPYAEGYAEGAHTNAEATAEVCAQASADDMQTSEAASDSVSLSESEGLKLLVDLLREAQMKAEEAQEARARAERQVGGLLYQLDGYRRMLTEHAESLAEERTRSTQADELEHANRELAEKTEALARDNARIQENWEKERELLTLQLKEARTELDGLRQRSRPWWQKLFGT